MRPKIITLLLSIFFITSHLQAQVNATLNLVPPYSTKLSDYASHPGKLIMTLTNTSTRSLQVMLRVSITGINNGIEIRTKPGYIPGRPITLLPSVPVIVDVQTLQEVFDINNLLMKNTSTNDIFKKNGLPEGAYQFCVRAYDYTSPNTALSADIPGGCTTAQLTMIEAPYLTKPFAEQKIEILSPQNMIFSWVLPAGAPTGTQFMLRIVEMPPGQKNANAAYATTTRPPFFETITQGNVYLYGPAQPMLVPGRSYAWSVTALDRFSTGTAFRNGGRSEVRAFTINPVAVATRAVNVANGGKMLVQGNLNHIHWENNLREPVFNARLKVYIAYEKRNDNAGGFLPQPDYPAADNGKVIDTVTTDEFGNFSFKLNQENALGIVAGTNPKIIRVIKARMVNDSRDYFTDVEGSISVIDGQASGLLYCYAKTYNLKVFTYDYTDYKKTDAKSRMYDEGYIYLLRKEVVQSSKGNTKSFASPAHDGDMAIYPDGKTSGESGTYDIPGKGKCTVIAKKNFSNGQPVTFNGLIKNSPVAGDEYIIQAIYKKPGDKIAQVVFDAVNFKPPYHSDPNEETVSGYSYAKRDYEVSISPKKFINFKLSGTINSHWAQQLSVNTNPKPDLPLKNVTLTLQAVYLDAANKYLDPADYPMLATQQKDIYATTTTDKNGNFTFAGSISQQDGLGPVQLPAAPGLSSWGTRVLRVIVENQYYCSPDDNFQVTPGYSYDAGQLKADVKETIVNVTVKKNFHFFKQYFTGDDILRNAKVYLCRKAPSKSIPPDEGNKSAVSAPVQKDKGNVSYQVVGEGISDENGICQFTRLVQSRSLSDEYFVGARASEDGEDNFESSIFTSFHASYINTKHPVFNSKNNAQTNSASCNVHAQVPHIAGTVRPKSNTASESRLSYAQVTAYRIQGSLVKSTYNSLLKTNGETAAKQWLLTISTSPFFTNLRKQQATGFTGENGEFYFEGSELDLQPSGKIPPYFITIHKNGFLDEAVMINAGDSIKMGQKVNLDVYLQLPIKVYLTLVSEGPSPQYLKCKAVIGDNFSWAQSGLFGMAVDCPRGDVKVMIYPDDMDHYMPTEITLKNIGDQDNGKSRGTYEIPMRKQRIDFIVKNSAGNMVKNAWAELMDAQVKIISTTSIKIADGLPMSGKPDVVPSISFQSTATYFTFRIHGTDAQTSYQDKTVVVSCNPENGIKIVPVQLKTAGTLRGKILLGNTRSSSEKPKVYYEDKETFANRDGEYELKGLPVGIPVKVTAVFPGTAFVGETKEITISSQTNSAEADFHLQLYPSLQLNTIAGLPVEISGLEKKGTDQYEVSGRFVNLPANDAFTPAKDASLHFSKIKVIAKVPPQGKGTNKILVPAFWPIVTDEWAIDLLLYKKFKGELENGVEIENEGDNQGAVTGQVKLLGKSFTDGITINTSLPAGGNNLTTKHLVLEPRTTLPPGTFAIIPDITRIRAFKASAGAQPKELAVSYNDGTNMQFNLHNEYKDCVADASGSYLNADGLHLKTILHTSLKHFDKATADIKLTIPDILVTQGSTPAVSGKSPIKLPMGKWSIDCQDWELSTSGLILKNAILNAGATVPVKDLKVAYDELKYGSYSLDKMKILNTLDLSMNSNPMLSFGYDTYADAWTLTALPEKGQEYCASFSLNGFTDPFRISSIRARNTGDTKVMLSATGGARRLYNVADFVPGNSLTLSTNYLKINGSMDLGIPNLQLNDGFALIYEVKNNQLQLVSDSIVIPQMHMSGIRFTATGGGKLTQNSFSCKGTLSDEKDGVFELPAVMAKDAAAGTSISVAAGQKFYLQKGAGANGKHIELTEIAKMNVVNNTWEQFRFKGEGRNMGEGIDVHSKFSMIVKGDVICDPAGTKVGVSGMDFGDNFKGMSFIYNAQTNELLGSMHIEQVKLLDGTLTADVETLIGGSGWYFFAGGSFDLPPSLQMLVKKVNAGFYVGKYNMSTLTGITAILKSYSYDQSLPDNMPTADNAGFFVRGGFEMPIPKVPEFDISVPPIAKASLSHRIGANMSFGMLFNNPTIILGGGLMANVHASVGGTVIIGCAGLDLDVTSTITMKGSLNSKQLSLDICGDITLKGDGYYGYGVCDCDCDGLLCDKSSFGGTLSMCALLHGDSGGNIDFNLGLTNCKSLGKASSTK